MSTKLIFLGCVVSVVLLSFFYPTPPQSTTSDAVTISFSFWGSYEEWNMWRDIVAAFEAKNPDVRVKLNYIPSGYDDKIRLLLAANSAPDVMMIQDEPFPGYARYGKFADLTDWAYAPDAPVDWKRDFWPTAPESFVYNGRVFGMPVFGGNILVFYNRKMFQDLGVDPPSDDWTFDEFVEKAQALTRDLNGDGRRDTFGIMLPHWLYFMPWTLGFGVNYLNDARTDWAFSGPDALTATQFYQDLRHKFHVAPSIQEIATEQEGAMFMTGRIAMQVGGPWTSLPLKTAGLDFDVVHMPVGPMGKRFTRVTWDSLCMFSKSPHKKEAWRFMMFCVSYEGQAIVGKCARSIPVLIAAKDTFINPDNGWDEEKFIAALDYAVLQPITYQWDKMRQIMDARYEQLLLNKKTPEETVEALANEMRTERVFPIPEGSP
ncbi:MAG: sugar ABC transporter substrate-binding protein [Candidatus Hydrogenedentes bacterium]|nr:sugar ABC transporter substrate-binding protein [Candidatus Hydrogenedentota bacterium]